MCSGKVQHCWIVILFSHFGNKTVSHDNHVTLSISNEIGIKHWKLNINEDGKFTWGKGNKLFDSLELFVQVRPCNHTTSRIITYIISILCQLLLK